MEKTTCRQSVSFQITYRQCVNGPNHKWVKWRAHYLMEDIDMSDRPKEKDRVRSSVRGGTFQAFCRGRRC
jgi:hypothetical protein